VRATVQADVVLRVWDHLRLRLRAPGADPVHAAGTDGRTPGSTRDTIYLSVYAYTFDLDGPPGFAAALKTDPAYGLPDLDVLLADSADIAIRHRAWNDASGYTPLGAYVPARFTQPADVNGVSVVIESADLHLRALWTELGPPYLITGHPPRSESSRVISLLREAHSSAVFLNDRAVRGAPFPHHGFEHWVGRPFLSTSVQLGETYLAASAASAVAL
jgi:hypothetical protein